MRGAKKKKGVRVDKKKRKKGKKRKKEEGERTNGEREKEKKKREIFPEFRRSELDGLRRKVDPHISSYAWVPKSWSFVKLHEVGNFPTRNIFSLKVMK